MAVQRGNRTTTQAPASRLRRPIAGAPPSRLARRRRPHAERAATVSRGEPGGAGTTAGGGAGTIEAGSTRAPEGVPGEPGSPGPPAPPGEGDDAGARGRWTGWRAVLVIGLFAAVVGAATWTVFFSSVLGVREIEVVGNLTVPAEQIQNAAAVPTGHPLATVDVDGVRARVLGIRQVGSAEVERAWPGTLRIAVLERKPVAVVPVSGKVALVDRYGVVIEVRPVASPRLPLLRVARPGPDDLATRAALGVILSLPAELAARVIEVRATTPENVSLRLGDGRTVVWGGTDRAEDKARILTTLLKRPADTYDVSSPEVVTVE
ncbi:FtsQ-type POTRA domain-containing protein [Spongiactinospora sp. TRM90649]|uniref:cell division protein FtsQ/DivIB n=1 Tax=Spongiactinospora sp. TRM90649 TaxID=3031114 RepID=UPI0023FA246A|nr:FtsQ-type POTRA domain-containing protein [Spongiactinospora sp. TRM90649]MDF5756865.1 FtsQ-type POTRA domain-containing protein [Spongiactinospora sp. TRM90649]